MADNGSTMMKQYVAVVSLSGRILHAVGPFETESAARAEGRIVADGVDMFAPSDSEAVADVAVVRLVENLSAMLK
jgi:hypothetical protein